MDLSVPAVPNEGTNSNLSESTVAIDFSGREQVDESRLVSRISNGDESPCERSDLTNGSQLVVLASTSSQHIKSLKLPSKRKSVGRPKGSVNNVIGIKRKSASKVKQNKKIKVTS